MKALLTQMPHDTVVDLSSKNYFFPENFLLSQGYSLQANSWDNGRDYYSLDLNSGITIHVVDSSEVWHERYGKLTHLESVKNCNDLLELERLLS